MERRDMMTAMAAMTGLTISSIATGAPPTIAEGDKFEARLSLDDRRFRRQFNIALRRLRRRGTITAQEHRKYQTMSYNTLKIASDSYGKQGAFVQLLNQQCSDLMKTSKDWTDNIWNSMADWFNWCVEWLTENWDTVLKLILTLVVFLETPTQEI